ncbi:MAG TPA: hypothetical protein VLC09_05955 [Polyangiaceae bacterium]|nr:hypothetical protein [Polyangiaceae bacterium]
MRIGSLFARWGLPALALLALPAFVGCRIDPGTGKTAVGIVGDGIVNDPGNKSLRFDILRFGMAEFCRELLQNGTPLRLADDQPVIGRFFASSCETKALDEPGRSTVLVQFGGKGYAWTLGTGRMGFRASGLLELAPDFRLHDGALYVYFRPVHVDTSDFGLLMTESALTQAAMQVSGVDEVEMGRAVISAQLGRGFTVIRYDADGHTDFGIGLIAPGEVPFRPFTVVSSPRRTLANGRTELFLGQQDYVGKLHLEDGEALTITLDVDGVDAVDLAVVRAADSPKLVDDYVTQRGAAHLEAGVVFRASVAAVAPFKTEVPLVAGDYYLVFDHSAAFGATTPGEKALPARVDYLLQVGARSP